MIVFEVHGEPGPQGSKKFVGINKKTGRGMMVESSKQVKPWREAIKTAAVAAGVNGRKLSGALALDVTFTLRKLPSIPKSRRYPFVKPDLSKLVRSTEDALVEVQVIEDDARIVSTVSRKFYPGTDPDAMASPGCRIIVYQVEA